MLRRLLLLTFTVALAVGLLVSAASAQDSYLDLVEKSIAYMESGDYNQAAVVLTKALALDANESLGHLCLATVYAHTGQPEQAIMEYKVALKFRADDPLAIYGLGIALLGRPDVSGALAQFQKVHAGAGIDAASALAYVKALKGQYQAASEQVTAVPDAASVQLRATALFKAGKYPEAREAMSDLSKTLPSKGGAERPGAVMTFNPKIPVSFTGGKLTKPIVSPIIKAASAPKASGTVRLKADLSKAPNVKFVTFYVDDQMVALVNHIPYEYNWDTRRVPNGLHSVKIKGQTDANEIVSQKSMNVRVENKNAVPHVLTGADVDALRSRLWDRVKLWPSIAAANYMLAKCADADGDKAARVAHLERVMAANPDYLDTRMLLKQALDKVEPYKELRQGPTAEKIIALTFDDGPYAETKQLLDILAEKNVKATFFVNGQRCEEFPEMIERMNREGHEIENHTYSHRNLQYLSVSEIEKELFRTIVILREQTGKRPMLFRPPGGHLNGNGKTVGTSYGLLPVFWTALCSRYEGTTVDTMVKYVDTDAAPGGIVLMHNPEPTTMSALPTIIDRLKNKGYRFVTVSEMFFGR